MALVFHILIMLVLKCSFFLECFLHMVQYTSSAMYVCQIKGLKLIKFEHEGCALVITIILLHF